MVKNLAVGHFYNEPFIGACEPWVGRIAEVFFAWPGVLSCRPAPAFTDALRRRLCDDLAWARSKGLRLDTLFNCNCYGDRAVSAELADFVTSTLNDMDAKGLRPDIVTTTSPFIAAVLRRRFPDVEVRGSVNLRVHGTIGFEHVADLFDSFYVSREFQRDFAYMEQCRAWAEKSGKRLGMQLNSGCLRECPFQHFHDNLHGHDRLRQARTGDDLGFNVFLCKTTYARKRFEEFIRSTWIRPEDAGRFAPYVSVMKISTRRVEKPAQIVAAYASGRFDGNLLELMDPDPSPFFAPYIVNNAAFPPDWAESGVGARCADNCVHCGRCAETLARVLKKRGADA